MSDDTRTSSIPSWLPWLVLALVAITGIRTVSHPDYWTHLEQSRAPLSGTDSLVYASNPEVLPNPSWLYDRIIGGVHAAGGPGASTVLHILVLVGAFGMLIPLLSKDDKGGLGGTSAAIALAGWLLLSRFEPRAAIFALIFPALFLRTLMSTRSMGVRMAILIPAQLVWTNVHWSFLFGPLIIIGFLAEELLEIRANEDGPRSFPIPTASLAGASILATVINPWFFGLHGHVLSAQRMMDPSAWQHHGIGLFDLMNSLVMYPHWSIYGNGPGIHAVNASLAIGALGLVLFRGKLPWGITFSAIFAALMTVQQFSVYREIFAICSLPFLAVAIGATGRYIQSKAGNSFPGGLVTIVIVLLISGVQMISVVNNSAFLRIGNGSSFGLGVAENVTPTGLLEILQEDGAPKRLLTSPITGNYLAANLEDGRVAIDARIHLHSPSTYKDLTTLISSIATGAEVNASDLPDAIIFDLQDTRADATVPQLYAAGWRPVFLDGLVLMLVQDPTAYPNASEWMKAGLDDLNHDVARSKGGGSPFYAPLSHRSVGGGRALTTMGLIHPADQLLTVAEAVNPTVKGLALSRGLVKLSLGDADLAIRYLEIARQNSPKNIYTIELLVKAYELGKRNHEADTLKVQLKELKGELDAAIEADSE